MPTIKKATDISWTSIVKSIEAEKCVLVIGNDLLFREEGKEKVNILELLKAEILEKLKESAKKYETDHDQCDLGHLVRELMGIFNGEDIWLELERQYLRGIAPNPLYKKIAEIPFSLILSTSPDNYLESILFEMGIPYQKDFLKHTSKKGSKISQDITREFPAIFSLFGSIEDTESLVLNNYNITTRLISSLYKEDNKLPPLVVEKINEAKHCIFLGVNFDDWYTNILLDILHFNKYNTKNTWNANYAFCSRPEVDESTEFFYEDNFKIGFICIKEFDISSFVNGLYDKTKAYNPKLLRTKSDHPERRFIVDVNIIRQDLKRSVNLNLMEIVGAIRDLIDNKDLNMELAYQQNFINKLDAQESQFTQIKDDKVLNLIKDEDLEVRFSDIRDNIRIICDDIEKYINRG